MAQDRCNLRGERVLIVNDDEPFAEALREALEGKGYTVQRVDSAAEGLGMAGLFRPRVIVTGLLLEEHDSGFRLAREIKTHPLTRDMGVILVTNNRERTGFSFSQEKDGAWMRTDRYLERPLEPDAVVREVEAVLAETAAEREDVAGGPS